MLVGFAGLAGAGKNEAAKALNRPQLAFADPIKALVTQIDPFISFHPASGAIRLSQLLELGESFELVKRNSTELRRLLQEIGVGIRNHDPEFWVNALDNGVRGAGLDSVITDVRFLNEVEYVRSWWGKTIWIERPGTEQGSHISENSISAEDCEGYVLNDGTIEELHEKVRAEVKALETNE
jgi:hypothetical protein